MKGDTSSGIIEEVIRVGITGISNRIIGEGIRVGITEGETISGGRQWKGPGVG